jgi:hypothetical protein
MEYISAELFAATAWLLGRVWSTSLRCRAGVLATWYALIGEDALPDVERALLAAADGNGVLAGAGQGAGRWWSTCADRRWWRFISEDGEIHRRSKGDLVAH